MNSADQALCLWSMVWRMLPSAQSYAANTNNTDPKKLLSDIEKLEEHQRTRLLSYPAESFSTPLRDAVEEWQLASKFMIDDGCREQRVDDRHIKCHRNIERLGVALVKLATVALLQWPMNPVLPAKHLLDPR